MATISASIDPELWIESRKALEKIISRTVDGDSDQLQQLAKTAIEFAKKEFNAQ